MQGLFHDDLQARTYPGKSAQGLEGVFVILRCPECGREVRVHYPWHEIQALLQGQTVQGVMRDGRGFQGEVPCSVNCHTHGNRTKIKYRVTVQDFKKHLQNRLGRAL